MMNNKMKLIGAPIHLIIDTIDDIQKRGHRDYTNLHNKIREVFNA
tara:strand:- start:184 stop:318 length:135 start_codon:yes stop_codon:yes gene_type:complete